MTFRELLNRLRDRVQRERVTRELEEELRFRRDMLEGELRDFRDGAVTLGPGELFVVPRGVEHKPYAARQVTMLLIEPRGVTNTGSAGGERTAQNELWI